MLQGNHCGKEFCNASQLLFPFVPHYEETLTYCIGFLLQACKIDKTFYSRWAGEVRKNALLMTVPYSKEWGGLVDLYIYSDLTYSVWMLQIAG